MLPSGMASDTPSQSGDDWRLEAELESAHSGLVHELVGRFRGPAPVKEIQASVAHDVMVTHDGQKLFAYAATQEALASARATIEEVLRREEIGATVRVSTWDQEFDRWRQVDPPPPAGSEPAGGTAADGGATETRTLIAGSGNLVRKEFEETMQVAAQALGLECTFVEHPHLLTTQVAFTVTGPAHKIEVFASQLKAEGYATLRVDRELVISPL